MTFPVSGINVPEDEVRIPLLTSNGSDGGVLVPEGWAEECRSAGTLKPLESLNSRAHLGGQDTQWLAFQVGVGKRVIPDFMATSSDLPCDLGVLLDPVACDKQCCSDVLTLEDRKRRQCVLRFSIVVKGESDAASQARAVTNDPSGGTNPVCSERGQRRSRP